MSTWHIKKFGRREGQAMTSTAERSAWRVGVAFDHAFVWCLLAVPFSAALWIVLMMLQALIGESLDITTLAYPAHGLVWPLFKRGFFSPENLPALVMYATVLPWMVVGWFVGFLWGWRLTQRSVLNARGFRIFSLLAVLGLLFVGSMAFWF
jgi:hypothetical protein